MTRFLDYLLGNFKTAGLLFLLLGTGGFAQSALANPLTVVQTNIGGDLEIRINCPPRRVLCQGNPTLSVRHNGQRKGDIASRTNDSLTDLLTLLGANHYLLRVDKPGTWEFNYRRSGDFLWGLCSDHLRTPDVVNCTDEGDYAYVQYIEYHKTIQVTNPLTPPPV